MIIEMRKTGASERFYREDSIDYGLLWIEEKGHDPQQRGTACIVTGESGEEEKSLLVTQLEQRGCVATQEMTPELESGAGI